MDLNNIALNPHLVAGLYPRSLVQPLPAPPAPAPAPVSAPVSVPEAPAAETEEPAYPSLGKNKRGILLIVDEPGQAFLSDSSLQFLTSVLTACKFTLDDIALLNFGQAPAGYKALLDHFRSRQVLLFGVDPVRFGLPVNFPPFQLQAFDKATYLFAPPLPEIGGDKGLKGKLWTCLKTLFSI